MLTQEILNYILGLSAMASIILTVWTAIKKPQQKAEMFDAVIMEKFNSLEKVVINLRDNHIHTISENLTKHIAAQAANEMLTCEKLAKIETHLETLIKK